VDTVFLKYKTIDFIELESHFLQKAINVTATPEVHFYGRLINILVNSELSKILKDEVGDDSIVFSEKKIFKNITYYLYKLHHYDYKINRILDKLKVVVSRYCLKSKKKGFDSSDNILKLII